MAINGTEILLLVDVSGVNTVVGSQRGLTVDETTDAIDASSKDQREMRVLPGRYESTMSLEHLYVQSDGAYQELRDANRNGTFVSVVRQEEGAEFEEASAIVTSVSGDFPDQGEAVISVELQVDGAWSAVV